MAQLPYALDLRDLMDARYGAGGWTQRTDIGVGTDIGPAIADGVATLRVTMPLKRGKILVPPGQFMMATSPCDLSGISIEGVESQASVIVYNNAAGAAFSWSGAGGYTGGGMKGISLLLESGLGDTGAYGILLKGDATFQPDQTEWEDIYMSAIGGSSFWWTCFNADGSARVPNPKSSLQGVRVSALKNLQLFNSRNVPFYGANLVQWTLENVGVYTGKGQNGNSIMITGNSTHVYGQGVNGLLNITNTIDVMINGQRFS